MSDDDDVLTSLQFHDNRFKPDDHIAITFASTIAVVVFIVVASFEVFGVLVGDLLIGESVADTRIKFIEGFPLKFVISFR